MTYKNSEFSQKNSTLNWQRKQSYYDFLENQKPDSWIKPSSDGEKILEKLLTELGYDFNTEHTFKDCLSPLGNRLRFDFCLLDKSSIPWKPILLIELQGKHHFNPVYGQQAFQEIQTNDKIKADWCKEKGLPFLEIYSNTNLTAEWLDKEIKFLLSKEDWTC